MAYVRLDKIKPSAHIETFVHTQDVQNGQFVNVGGLADVDQPGEAVNVTFAEEGGEAEALVTTVQGVYQNGTDFDITQEVTKAGKAGRAHVLETGNVVSFLVDQEDVANFTVGGDVAVGEGGLGIKPAVEGDTVIGTVLTTEVQNNVGDLVVVRIK